LNEISTVYLGGLDKSVPSLDKSLLRNASSR